MDGAVYCVRHGVHGVGEVRRADNSGGDHSGGNGEGGGNVAETGVSKTSVGETSVAETGVAETSIAETGMAKTGVAETSVAKTGVAETVQTKAVAEDDRGGSDLSGGGLIGVPLPPAGHGGAEVVCAQADVAGVDEPGGGVGHRVHGVGDAGNNSMAETSVAETSVAETSVAKTSIAETSVAETSVAEVSGVRSGNSNLGVGVPLAVMAEVSVVAVADVADSAGHGVVGGVHTGGGLEPEGMAVVSVPGVAMVSVPGVAVVVVGVGGGVRLPLLTAVQTGGIGESGVGQGRAGTRHRQVGGVDTGGALASEGVHAICVGVGQGGHHLGAGSRHCGKSDLRVGKLE